jgi:hypothetical protein
VQDRGIALETSPSSNLQTGAIAAWGDELVDHPFDMLYQLGSASRSTPTTGCRARRRSRASCGC